MSGNFLDLCDNFNIKIIKTAAETPWSNNICERQNEILTKKVYIKYNIDSDWETPLVWALNAKNSLINISGFSSHQVVLGKSIVSTSTFADKLTAECSHS